MSLQGFVRALRATRAALAGVAVSGAAHAAVVPAVLGWTAMVSRVDGHTWGEVGSVAGPGKAPAYVAAAFGAAWDASRIGRSPAGEAGLLRQGNETRWQYQIEGPQVTRRVERLPF